MRAARAWDVPRRMVHVIDREADSQVDFRKWSAEKELFLVRADFTRKVDWQGASYQLPELTAELDRQQQFIQTGAVTMRGKNGICSRTSQRMFRRSQLPIGITGAGTSSLIINCSRVADCNWNPGNRNRQKQ